LGVKTRLFNETAFKQLISMIQYKCCLIGVKVQTINEAYTSKVSALDLEPIKKLEKYIGLRICRGLFKTSSGFKINADVNACLNILRKYLCDV
jgi:transposase